jgi:geranylgeranyl diphosphate synthase type I
MQQRYTKHIQQEIKAAYAKLENEFSLITPQTKDLSTRMQSMTLRGKLSRGSLVLLTSELFDQPLTDNSYKIAAAMEIFHTALLIHDDIMDNDSKRRGQDAIFFQYQKQAQQFSILQAEGFGKSAAICAGDIGFFLAYQTVDTTTLAKETVVDIYKQLNTELITVGLGQLQDITSTLWGQNTSADILSLYKYKTGRYTFSLPFSLGAILAKQPGSVISLLQELGEKIGIIFQLKDDEIGIFSQEDYIGKPIGSDIREGKKTLYYLYLFEQSNTQEKEKISQLFGNPNITNNDIEYIRNLIYIYKIQTKIEEQIQKTYKEIMLKIRELPLKKQKQQLLQQLVENNIVRKK